jgi:hypothetical protein
VFLWGQKQEKTHTWYGMFLPEGNRLNPVDAMTVAWTGHSPTNRCPQIGSGRIQARAEAAQAPTAQHVFAPGTRLRCQVDATEPEGQPLTVRWDLRLDVADHPGRGGDREPATPPIEGAILSTEATAARVQLPAEAGNYRLFVYVLDPHGAAATANLPVRVQVQP